MNDQPMIKEENNQIALQNNLAIINEIIVNWDCTKLEGWASLIFDTETLKETQKLIAKFVTYARFLKALPTEYEEFLRKENYKDELEIECDKSIESEAKEMASEQAWMFIYEWEQYDDYDEMTEVEKEEVLFGTTFE